MVTSLGGRTGAAGGSGRVWYGDGGASFLVGLSNVSWAALGPRPGPPPGSAGRVFPRKRLQAENRLAHRPAPRITTQRCLCFLTIEPSASGATGPGAEGRKIAGPRGRV